MTKVLALAPVTPETISLLHRRFGVVYKAVETYKVGELTFVKWECEHNHRKQETARRL